MKIILGVLALSFCLSAHAGEMPSAPPSYLESFRGVILASLLERGTFEFTPGALSNCTRDEVAGMVVYRCDTQGAELAVNGLNGVSGKLVMSKVHIISTPARRGDIARHFYFKGTYIEPTGAFPEGTAAGLTLSNLQSAPTKIQGVLKFGDYDISASLVSQ